MATNKTKSWKDKVAQHEGLIRLIEPGNILFKVIIFLFSLFFCFICVFELCKETSSVQVYKNQGV